MKARANTMTTAAGTIVTARFTPRLRRKMPRNSSLSPIPWLFESIARMMLASAEGTKRISWFHFSAAEKRPIAANPPPSRTSLTFAIQGAGRTTTLLKQGGQAEPPEDGPLRPQRGPGGRDAGAPAPLLPDRGDDPGEGACALGEDDARDSAEDAIGRHAPQRQGRDQGPPDHPDIGRGLERFEPRQDAQPGRVEGPEEDQPDPHPQ